MFHFTIRDMLWLIGTAALGCAWYSDRRVLVNELQANKVTMNDNQARIATMLEYQKVQQRLLRLAEQGRDAALKNQKPSRDQN